MYINVKNEHAVHFPGIHNNLQERAFRSIFQFTSADIDSNDLFTFQLADYTFSSSANGEYQSIRLEIIYRDLQSFEPMPFCFLLLDIFYMLQMLEVDDL